MDCPRSTALMAGVSCAKVRLKRSWHARMRNWQTCDGSSKSYAESKVTRLSDVSGKLRLAPAATAAPEPRAFTGNTVAASEATPRAGHSLLTTAVALLYIVLWASA